MPKPDYVKMDVDGIEHYILNGGSSTLSKIQGILIEINDDFIEQSDQSRKLLEASGLSLIDKRHAEMFEGTKFQNVYNQIWERK